MGDEREEQERCRVCGEPFAKGEGRYRDSEGAVHMRCAEPRPKS